MIKAMTMTTTMALGLMLTGCINVVDKEIQPDTQSDAQRMAEEDDIPVRGETPGFACKADGMSAYVGRTATSDIGAAILAQSGARQLRWIPLGAAVTMDYRGDRVNVRLDGANAVTVVTCG